MYAITVNLRKCQSSEKILILKNIINYKIINYKILYLTFLKIL